jgi:hypothetical protein
MGCGCQGKDKKILSYEHTRQLAQKYAASTGKTCILYQDGTGSFRFCEADSQEATTEKALEYIPAL